MTGLAAARPAGLLNRAGRALARNYSILVVLALYEVISRLHLVSPRLLPSLVVVLQQLWRNLANGVLFYHAGVSLYRAFAGFCLALVVGIAVGVLMERSRWADRLIEPIFTFGYPIPKISLYPVFIFIFGLGTGSKIALVFLECIYPIALHAMIGIRSVDPTLLRAAQNMGVTRTQLFWKVLVPASLPILFTGIRIALPIALIITLVTEIIGESKGLGYFITFASASFEYARAIAAFFVIAVIGFILDRALLAIQARLVFWDGGKVSP